MKCVDLQIQEANQAKEHKSKDNTNMHTNQIVKIRNLENKKSESHYTRDLLKGV